jgi:predicted enzyme related to lactoylglutathione lyase
MSSTNPVVHFEMPYEDGKRVAEFYSKAFNWKMVQAGEEMGNYVTAETTESSGFNRSITPGAINGGFFPKKEGWPAQSPSVVISVDDIEEAMKKIIEAGGEVLDKPTEIPGVGKYVSFKDTEGNRASLLQV